MPVTLRPLTEADVIAHNQGEDAETVRWLTGDFGSEEHTARHFRELAFNLAVGQGKRGFGVWLGEKLAGYIDCDPDFTDRLQPGDVNIAYAVHPWARGQGVATEAVHLMCDFIAEHRVGTRAIIRAQKANVPSVRVAQKAGFTYLGPQRSLSDRDANGQTVIFEVYTKNLTPAALN